MIRRAPLSCSKPSLVAELLRELPTEGSTRRPTLAGCRWDLSQLPRKRGWVNLRWKEIQGTFLSCGGNLPSLGGAHFGSWWLVTGLGARGCDRA